MGDGRWKFAFRRWLLHRLFGSLYQKARRGYCEADGVCAVSQEYLDLVAAIRSNPTAQPLNPHDLYLCYVGGKLIEACDPPASDLQRSSSKKTVTFIYVGAMTPTYDLATVLEAAKVLKLEGWAFDLVFAGSGVSEPILQERVVQMGLQKEVRFLGFLDQANLESALRSADVGLNAIMPGTFITMPHKLSDYLCAGLAVINSITGEAEDLLSEFDAGVFYEAENVDSLAECMRDYIRDADRLASQKSAAYRLAQEKFDRRKTYTELAHWILKM